MFINQLIPIIQTNVDLDKKYADLAPTQIGNNVINTRIKPNEHNIIKLKDKISNYIKILQNVDTNTKLTDLEKKCSEDCIKECNIILEQLKTNKN